MLHCEPYQDQLLDLVYGLLEEPEQQELRGHLAGCSLCQAALAEAQSQKHLLARAARVIPVVPEFVPPVEEAPATLPIPALADAPVPRRSGLRPLFFWAAAAAIVLAVGSWGVYRQNRSTYESELADARQRLQEAEASVSVLTTGFAGEQTRLMQQIPGEALQVHVLGPKQFHPASGGVFQVTTRDLQGQPATGTVTARLLGADEKVLHETAVPTRGQARIVIPAVKAESVRLVVEARTDKAQARVEETLRVSPAALAAHVATSKSSYRPGDALFFRVLALERFSLQPPAKPVPLRAELVNVQNNVIAQLSGTTDAAGIFAGQLRVAENLDLGKYTLRVQPAGPGIPLAAQSLPLEVVREVVQVDASKQKATPSKSATPPTVEFYPEGGDLVAGVKTKVYYRVSAADPKDQSGSLTLLSSQGKLPDSRYVNGLGSFEFTPDLQETYTVQLQSIHSGNTKLANPFQKLGIKAEGLVLQVRDSIGKEGDAITVRLHNQGNPRRVLLLAECRGQMVDEQWVEVGAGETTVALQPVSGARGVVRITAYEAPGESWQPLAERLVYRVPGGRLQLKYTATGKAGQTVKMDMQATDEAGQPASAWVGAAVVEDRYRLRETGLDSHFYVLGDVRTQPLEEVPLVVGAKPQALQQLELFLGTHGWRRFVQAEQPTLARVDGAPATLAAAPALLSRENVSLSELRRQVQARLNEQLANLRAESEPKLAAAAAARQTAFQAVMQARSALESYEQLPQQYLRIALALVLLVALAGGVILLGAGLAQVLRRGLVGTPAFAAAFACLLVGVGLTVAILQLRPVVSVLDQPLPEVSKLASPKLSLPPAIKGEPLPPTGSFATARPAASGLQVASSIADPRLGTKAWKPNLPPSENKTPQPVPSNQPDFTFRQGAGLPADTLLWLPEVNVEHGTATLSFDTPVAVEGYRVVLFGHSAGGRLGFLESRLDIAPQR